MKEALRKLVTRTLRETADKIEAGTCEMTEEEAMDIMSAVSHQAMSKAEAYKYLNLSRSRFDDLVRKKKLPRGRKRKGYRELSWYRDILDDWLIKLKLKNR